MALHQGKRGREHSKEPRGRHREGLGPSTAVVEKRVKKRGSLHQRECSQELEGHLCFGRGVTGHLSFLLFSGQADITAEPDVSKVCWTAVGTTRS